MVALSSPDKLLKELEESGNVKTLGVAMQRKIAPLSDLISLFKIIRVFRKERPDLVHSITPKAGLLSMIAAKITNVPYRVHTFTGLVFPTSKGLKRRILSMCDKITCVCATHVIAEGKGVKHDLYTNGITGKEIRIIGNGNMRGVDMEYFHPDSVHAEGAKIRETLRAKEDTVIFLFVGRFVPDKGMGELVGAFNRILKEGIDASLLLVGEFEKNDYPDKTTLDEISGNSNIFTSEGWIEDVRPYYSAADVLILPSHREGFPNVVLEAGAMNLPSIVTDINGSREIISDNVNGLIIQPCDEDALFKGMKKLALDRPLRLKMGEKARKNVATFFEQSFVRKCHKDFYRNILG